MSRLEIILGIVAAVSVVFNLGLILYLKGALVRLISISEELGDFQQMVNAFASHLKTVYELEMFYGDQTLESLLEHARSFNEYLDTFEYIYTLTDEKEFQLDDDTTTEEEIEEEG
jgi:hypothetical protein|tara:strand:+ start:257 stop:601 length:345 start_codon:yes stop_codon:yes gene_type:complete